MDLERQLDQAQALLTRAGVDDWELLATRSQSLNIGVKDQEVDKFVEADSQGLALRLLRGGCLGFSYVIGGGPDGLQRAVEQALASADAADPEEALSLAGPAQLPPAPQVFDPALADDPLEAKVERARRLAAAARQVDPRITHVHPAEYSQDNTLVLLRTSQGLELSQHATRVSVMANALASQDGQQEEAWEGDSRRFLGDLDVETVGRSAGEKAVALLGAGPVPDGRYDVILQNQVAADFLELLASSLLGDNVVKGRSLLASRRGQKICSPLVNIIDDGLYPRGLGSGAFDDEGTPQSRKVLIQAGVLEGFVFDRLWGARHGAASTGNAVRGSLKSPPGVGFSNLYLEPGTQSPAELAQSMGQGLIISEVLGGHTADPVSGQFSFGAAGHLVEGGRPVRAVKSIAMAGQVLEMFSAIQAVGADLRFFGRVGSPSLLVRGISISG
jgi:PmbA protein